MHTSYYTLTGAKQTHKLQFMNYNLTCKCHVSWITYIGLQIYAILYHTS